MISVIIPVYNGEQYIKETIDSVLNQSYKELEIILVNDGSTDHSGEICKEYAIKDSRIRCFNQYNQGLSAARNTGIKNAKGDFLFFLDADDILENSALEIMLYEINNNRKNIVVCNFKKFVSTVGEYDKKNGYKVIEYTKEEYMRKVFLLEKHTYAWGVLIPKSIMRNIQFPEGKYFEDMATMYKVILNAEKIKYIDEELVRYRQHEGSIVASMNEKKALHYIDAVDTMCEYVCNKLPNLEQESKVIQCYCKIAVIERGQLYENQVFIKNQKSFVYDYIKIAQKEVKIPMQKIKFLLFRISPKLYFHINKLKNK